MKIMVFSGSAGPRPDCSFAFKFLIYQSITQLTVYDATVIIKLNAFYRFFIVSGTTLFSLYGAATLTSHMIFRVPGQYKCPQITFLNCEFILFFQQRKRNQKYICTLITILSFIHILFSVQGIIYQNYIFNSIQFKKTLFIMITVLQIRVLTFNPLFSGTILEEK